MSQPPDLALSVGRRMRALRDQHDVTADALAAHARRIGLSWQRSTVASLETGRRRLTGEELLLLPLLLSMALPVRVRLRDLLDTDIALTDELVMTPNGFRELLSEGTPVWGGYRLRSTPTDEAEPESTVASWRRIEEVWPEVTEDGRMRLDRVRAVLRAAAGEAEQNAARTLGRTPVEVAAAAHAVWGRGLTAERDARVVREGTSESGVGLRVRRGHVTRQLVEDIAAVLDRLADARRPPPADG